MTEYSEFYLERVGHEANGKLRQKLKKGKNLIGRIECDMVNISEVSIGLDSLFCSRRHCVITVSGNSVDIQDFNTLNGTTVNGVIIKGETKKLDELDVIGIVGGSFHLSYLVGNYNCFVYRLRKYNSNNLTTIEIEDIDIFEISDDDDDIVKHELDSEVICLDHSKLELDVNIVESCNREFKKELKEIDELDAYCKLSKNEPCNSFQFEGINEVRNEVNNIAPLNPHQELDESTEKKLISPTDRVHGSLKKFGTESISIDRAEGSDMCFQNIDTNSQVKLQRAILKVSDRVEKQRPKLIEPECLQKRRKMYDYQKNGTAKPQTAPVHKKYTKDKLKYVQDESTDILPTDIVNGSFERFGQVVDDMCFQTIDTNSELKLQRAVIKVSDRTVEKQRPKMIEPQPLQKRRQTVNFDYQQNGKPKPQTSVVYKEYIKDKLKRIAAAKPEFIVEKPKEKITPKVKITRNNRGAFLTDPAQIPVLPRKLTVCRRKTVLLSKSSNIK